MRDLGHGANVDSMASKYNKDPKNIIDFSSNINFNLVDNLEKYTLEGLNNCSKYPDINYMKLRINISEYLNIKPDFIIPGNGATEIIYLLMKVIGNTLAIFNPTFSEYERSARLNGIDVFSIELKENMDFKIDLDKVEKNIDKFDSLFICNPNNPTGKVQDIIPLLELMEKNNKLLIVDETFMEFVEYEEQYSLVKFIEKYNNLFILKAATKFFGMPGLRLGYGLTSNKEIINNIYKYKEPWTVNSFADTLSNYIFKDNNYIESSKKYYANERRYMVKELSNIENIKVFETDTNFILLKLFYKKAFIIKEELLDEASILIREASNFIGLDESFIRVAIKSHHDNELLIKNIRKLMEK